MAEVLSRASPVFADADRRPRVMRWSGRVDRRFWAECHERARCNGKRLPRPEMVSDIGHTDQYTLVKHDHPNLPDIAQPNLRRIREFVPKWKWRFWGRYYGRIHPTGRCVRSDLQRLHHILQLPLVECQRHPLRQHRYRLLRRRPMLSHDNPEDRAIPRRPARRLRQYGRYLLDGERRP